jgi:hypothetical protein
MYLFTIAFSSIKLSSLEIIRRQFCELKKIYIYTKLKIMGIVAKCLISFA